MFVVFPARPARGLVVVLVGGLGTGFEGLSQPFLKGLAARGLEIVIVSWVDPWLVASPGEKVGPKRLACRAATAIKWVHDNLYRQLGSPGGAVGACGFCLTGNSGGSSQIGYSLSFYGLGNIVNAAILTDGPPHTALAKGCLGVAGYAFDRLSARKMDSAYGFSSGGPCSRHDSSFTSTWNRDSVDQGGVYKFPRTRIVFVFVSGDPTVAPAHGKLYVSALRKAKSPLVSERIVPGNLHNIEQVPAGRDAIEAALLSSG